MGYLSYSGWAKFDSCAFAYWHRYVNKTETPKENKINSLYGSTVGTLFEEFYEKKMWKEPDKVYHNLDLRVVPVLDNVMANEIKRGAIFDWSDPKIKMYKSKEDLIQDVREGVLRGLKIIQRHRLIGEDAKAEVVLDSTFGAHTVAGRADFIMRRTSPHNDLVILDGKGSKYRDKYVDSNQLKWYAALHRKKYNILPDRLGFVFWRSEPEDSVDLINTSSEDTDTLLTNVLETIETIEDRKRKLEVLQPGSVKKGKVDQKHYPMIEAEVFSASPTRECNLCSYLPMCAKGLAFMAEEEEKKKKKKSTLPGTGVRDMGFDDWAED